MEIWDAYNEDESLAGIDLIRGEGIPRGLYHMVSEVVVRHKGGMYLLMQRDLNKPNYPGMYEAGAGGAIVKGENPYDGAVRELREETGIQAKELKQIYRCMSSHTIYYGYLCETDCEKDSITLQEGETISYRWLTKDEFLKFVESDKFVDGCRERMSEYLHSIRGEKNL